MSKQKHMHLFVADGQDDDMYRYLGSACDLDGIGDMLDAIEVPYVYDNSLSCSGFDAKIMEAGEDGSLVTTLKLQREFNDDGMCICRSWHFQLRRRVVADNI